MPYLECPRCHTTFHTGVLYVSLDACPRCGASLYPPRENLGQHIRSSLFHRRGGDAGEQLDWETITSSQYIGRQYVTRAERPDDRTAA